MYVLIRSIVDNNNIVKVISPNFVREYYRNKNISSKKLSPNQRNDSTSLSQANAAFLLDYCMSDIVPETYELLHGLS
jgi:hypothetical protein